MMKSILKKLLETVASNMRSKSAFAGNKSCSKTADRHGILTRKELLGVLCLACTTCVPVFGDVSSVTDEEIRKGLNARDEDQNQDQRIGVPPADVTLIGKGNNSPAMQDFRAAIRYVNDTRYYEELINKYKKENGRGKGAQQGQREDEFNMPAALLIEDASGYKKVYVGIKREGTGKSEMKKGGIDVGIFADDYSHIERQLVATALRDYRNGLGVSNTRDEITGKIAGKGVKISVWTGKAPCNTDRQNNGGISCQNWYMKVAKLYPDITFEVYADYSDTRFVADDYQNDEGKKLLVRRCFALLGYANSMSGINNAVEEVNTIFTLLKTSTQGIYLKKKDNNTTNINIGGQDKMGDCFAHFHLNNQTYLNEVVKGLNYIYRGKGDTVTENFWNNASPCLNLHFKHIPKKKQ